jgi:hypothetical protein
MDKVAAAGLRPLVPAQAAKRLVVAFIYQVIQAEDAIMVKRHTVAHEEIALGLKVLHRHSFYISWLLLAQ